jgi:negative regulator of sigma E activity
MTTDDRELLSALLDREPVDADALARLLDDAEGRRTLVAFAALRSRAQAAVPGEAEWLRRHRLPARRSHGAWRLVGAAAALVVAVAVGMYVEQQRSREVPPAPARVVQFEPCPSNGGMRCAD